MSSLQKKSSGRLSTVKQVVSPLMMVWLVAACSSGDSAIPADETESAGSEQIVADTLFNDSTEPDSATVEPEQTIEFSSTDITPDVVQDFTDITPDVVQDIADTSPDADQDIADTTPDADQDIADTTPDADQDIADTSPDVVDLATDESTLDTSIDSLNNEGFEQTSAPTATDSETAEFEQTTTDDTGSDSDEQGTIPGLWNVTRGTDTQYFEARANGNVTVWDYRGDSFQNGQECYVKSIAFFRFGGSKTIEVFGENTIVDVDTNGRQVSFRDSDGVIDVPRADDFVTTDFTICGGDSNNFGAIPGLWDITVGDDVQYFEALADGNVSIWDYRADPFQNGQDCYVRSNAFFQVGGALTVEVFGEGVAVNVDTTGGQVRFTDIGGEVDFPRVIGITSREFDLCGEG